MKFLVDECCPVQIVQSLRANGYDVTYVVEMQPSMTDRAVLETAYSEERILITEDKDFGELIYRFQLPAKGIILLRFQISDQYLKWGRLLRIIEIKGADLYGKFTVVERNRFRLIALKGNG